VLACDQLLRAGTSVGAHFRAAQRAKSNPDFISRVEEGTQELEERLSALFGHFDVSTFVETWTYPIKKSVRQPAPLNGTHEDDPFPDVLCDNFFLKFCLKIV
jgi:hypothetical protein